MRRIRTCALVLTAMVLLGGGVAGPAFGTSPAATTPSGGTFTSASPGTAVPGPLLAPLPFSTGMPAALAMGVPNLTGGYPSLRTNASDFSALPEYAFVDAAGDLWVSDWGASRVLEFPPPFGTGEAASLVLGQSTFGGNASGASAVNLSSPTGLAMDAGGDLWVADWANQRVLEFVPPFRTGMAASLVLGQPNFTAHAAGHNASTFDDPVGLAFDPAGDLWVADRGNSRVLEFVPPFRSGMAASQVLGQPSFDSTAAGSGAANLSFPIDVSVAGPTLWVADELNDRVVGYSAPWTTGEAATYLLGQSGFGPPSASGPGALAEPASVSVDAQGTLWVSDSGDNRVVGFRPPYSPLELPSVVLGQPNGSGTSPGIGPARLSAPSGASVGPNGTLWVSDSRNDRLVGFVPPGYPVRLTEAGLPSGTIWSVRADNRTVSGVGPLSLLLPNGTHPFSALPVAGFVPDPSLLSVEVAGGPVVVPVVYRAAAPNPYSSGMAAILALGRPGLYAPAPPPGAAATSTEFGGPPTALAFDPAGDLWVADPAANRVVEFVPPFGDGMAAAVVLGQGSSTGRAPGTSATNLSSPDGIAFDSEGDLWIADGGNDRAVEFVPPFRTGMAAVSVLGEPNLTAAAPDGGPTGLGAPSGIAFGDGEVWVADPAHNRVVGFSAPYSAGEPAATVLGQADLNGSAPGSGATNLSAPTGVAVAPDGTIWVVDAGNGRVLGFPAPVRSGEAAAVVLGASSAPGLSDGELVGAEAIAVDPLGDVWVAEPSSNRTLQFVGQNWTNGSTPSVALGQGSVATSVAGSGPDGESSPDGVVAGQNGSIWVADGGNGRVVEYLPARFGIRAEVVGLPAGTTWSISFAGQTATAGAPNVSLSPMTNGTYPYRVGTVPGYLLSPASGLLTVNGANATLVALALPYTYPVVFTARGLGATEPWEVVVGSGPPQFGNGGGWIIALATNGTHPYRVVAPPGYVVVANGSGTVDVAGAPTSVVIDFAPTPPPSAGADLTAILVGAAAGVAVGTAIVLLGRRRPPGPAAPDPPPSPASAPVAGEVSGGSPGAPHG